MNGQGSSAIADKLIECNGDVGILRPWIDGAGNQYCTLTRNGKPVTVKMTGNATTTMRKDDWLAIDGAIIDAAKPRLKAVADLISNGNTFNINGRVKKNCKFQVFARRYLHI